MINDSLVESSAINATAHNGNKLPDDYSYSPCPSSWPYFVCIFFDFTILICIFGILGNGMVIWLLGFRIQRSPFTTFILNLAVADFGVLVATVMDRNDFSECYYILHGIFFSVFLFMFSTSQMFLTVISVDRCVSLFFPFWDRCHRPTWLSTVVCALTWSFSSLTVITAYIVCRARTCNSPKVIIYLCIANGFLCIPLMTISSLMLFLKVCCKSGQQRRQKLLTTVLVTVSFSLFCYFPFKTFMFMRYLNGGDYHFLYGAMFFACLNSSMNPLIYYLVGRQKEGRANKSMKGVLQNLFKEEET